jgi:hypothetical protein
MEGWDVVQCRGLASMHEVLGLILSTRERERETETERDRERETKRERQRERDREREKLMEYPQALWHLVYHFRS